MTGRVTVTVHLGPDDLQQALRSDVRAGLGAHLKELPPKWFYDQRGSELFDDITRLAEYYPTRCERQILMDRADTIATVTGADTLVELGSGTSDKTRALLDGLQGAGRLERFVAFDVSEATLRDAAAAIAGDYPAISVDAIVGDFERHLDSLPTGGRQLVAFLGGTIGNLQPALRTRFLGQLAGHLASGDSLLLGTDLVKDPGRLVAAYDDAQGVTAEFNRNVLHVINRELGADFAPGRFRHVAAWDADHTWIEMRLRAEEAMTVRIDALDMKVEFARGEDLRTEVSTKFTRERVTAELAAAGLALEQWWTDEAGDFGLSLARKP